MAAPSLLTDLYIVSTLIHFISAVIFTVFAALEQNGFRYDQMIYSQILPSNMETLIDTLGINIRGRAFFYRKLETINIVWFIAVYFWWSTVLQALQCAKKWRQPLNRLRWMEYTLSQATMAITVGHFIGLNSVAEILLLLGLMMAMMMFGYLEEFLSYQMGVSSFVPYFGILVLTVILAIVGTGISLDVDHATNNPGFIVALTILFYLFLSRFLLIPLVKYCFKSASSSGKNSEEEEEELTPSPKKKKSRKKSTVNGNYLTIDLAHLILNLVCNGTLAWVMFGGLTST